ncbi:hypothetical protein ACFWQ6_00710 [Streptomyces coelicoflavus]|uniref:hypothetical protein n=1 Tax=Streptomyces coelicoflavus TaxID=285562 RepID=UPI003646978D
MTISYVGQGGTAKAADTVTPAYTQPPSAGQLGILQVVTGHPDDPQPTTPSGWTLAGSFSGGGGAFGAGTGPRRITMFVREMTGGDAQPTTSIPSGGTGSDIAATIALLSRSAGTGWRWAWAAGEDTTAGTSFSAACTDALTWAVGDFAWWGYALADSSTGFPAIGITAAGVTFDTAAARFSSGGTTGNGLRTGAASANVTAGSATVAPTVTATFSTSTTGAAGVLRIREASATVSPDPQTVFPPRNLVSAAGLAADDIVSVSYYRQVGSTLTPVRAATDVDVTGQDVLLRVDAEQPFGVPYEYVAVLTDVNGLTWEIHSSTFTSTVDSDVISDAVRGTGARVFIEAWPEKKRSREATTFNVGGRLVTVGRPRSGAQSTITVSTDSTEEGDALQEVLDGLTEGVLLLRKQVADPRVDGYQALINDGERPNWQIQYSEWDLEVAESEAWPNVLEAAGFTLQDIADNYATLSDLAADFATLLDIALNDFGG